VKTLGWLLLLVLIGAVGLGFLVRMPYGPSAETFVEIAPGTGTAAMAAQLEARGIIRSRYAFDALKAVQGGRLQAGEYRFDHPAPLTEVYARLVKGAVYTRSLVIPEGYNIFDIAQTVEAAGLGSSAEFLTAERQHVELISQWSPQAASLEGYLFPDTYRFAHKTPPLQMLSTMVRRFRQMTTALGLTGDVAQTVTMASLIEKEVRVDSERPLVGGVFVNRLAQGIPLATDPTVIYAALLENRYRGTIYASDLQSTSAYNTYRHRGLPPGPICSPGVASLKAAMSPAKTDYLYFVSDAAGHSRFASSLVDHARNVHEYRKAAQAGAQP
jgi:UPF0755 protein